MNKAADIAILSMAAVIIICIIVYLTLGSQPAVYSVDTSADTNKGALKQGTAITLWSDPVNNCHYFVAQTKQGGIDIQPRLNLAGEQSGCFQ